MRLRDLGNTVIVVEHDEETIRAADHLIDLGPGAGKHGGEVIAEGTVAEVMANPKSITAQYLSGRTRIEVPPQRRERDVRRTLRVDDAREHNLQHVNLEVPLGLFVAVTGVSGSGKSTLIEDILHRALARHLYRARVIPGAHTRITGLEHLDKVIDIDQSPIGRTRPLLVQCEGRPLRVMPGRRAREDRDAFSSRRLRHLRDVQGKTLQSRDARGALPRAEHQ